MANPINYLCNLVGWKDTPAGHDHENTLTSGEEALTCSNVKYLHGVRQFDSIAVDKESFDSNEVVVSDGQRLRATSIRGSSETEQNKSIEAILTELRQWQKVHNHDDLIRIQGFHMIPDTPLLILISDYPYLTILEFLQLKQDVNHEHPPGDDPEDCASCIIPLVAFRRSSCVQIARGLEYLHAQRRPIVHGAIRGTNVLVKPDGTCCLGEFSEERKPSESTLTRYANWMSPELVDLQNFDRLRVSHYGPEYWGQYRMPSDVFALGCTCIEIYMNTPPSILRINYDKINLDPGMVVLDHRNHRQPTVNEKEKIPGPILSAIYSLLCYLPDSRRTAESARKMFELPDAFRTPITISVLEKRAFSIKMSRMIMARKPYA